ncbi:MAG: hypothetical protein FWD60_13140 [Candidatus Azobacteroides sp.]|nr:hypothetical protein [Candidatus Azobacteroides sp.]
MKKNNRYITFIFVFILLAISAPAQKINFIDPDNLLTKKENLSLEKALQYESDFFNRLFSNETVNMQDIRFIVVSNYLAFMNLQSKYGVVHVNSSGFFAPKDSTLVVFKDKKSEVNNFLPICYHEFSHAFLRLHTGDKYIPVWLNEGLADYLKQMTYDKNKITQQINNYSITRVKTLIDIKDLNLSEFVNWSYDKFSTESFTQEGYGYAVGYNIVLFLMQQQGEDKSFVIFRNLIGAHSTIEVLDKYYPGGFSQFEKNFVLYLGR